MMQNNFDALWDDKPVDVSAEVNMIWSIANKLRGPYQSDKYKDVIIPMTIIRRFECALAPTKDAVVKYVEKSPDPPEQLLFKKSGFAFFNRCPLTLTELCNDADNLAANFKEYILGFSSRVQEILRLLDFDKQIDKMEKNNRLLSVVKAFSELDLNPKTIDSIKMGYIFEDLIRRFSENAEAGDHYTGRDIVKLMVALLFAEGCDDLVQPGKVATVKDEAAGTGGILSTMHNFCRHFFPDLELVMFGQEINPESYAICLAEMMIKNQDADNVKLMDTMKHDSCPDQKMRFVAENPPFGTAWAGKDAPEGTEDAVIAEFERGGGYSSSYAAIEHCRWPAGLPAGGDMQLLFVQSAVHKLAPNGRAAIIENGSPLFTGGVSSGESQIRRWLLENDLIEAIVALPTDLFYNTGIATYIWLLSHEKSAKRRGKVQLINAAGFCHPLRKSLGNKRNEIAPEDRAAVVKLYTDFKENEFSQIHANEEFLYREYTVMRPTYDADGKVVTDKKGRPVWDKATKDKEIVPFTEKVEDYMAREVLPHVPDAHWELDAKKVTTGAEFPFTRYFYKYEKPRKADEILGEIKALQDEIAAGFGELGA